uniref:Uncharacterized protein n=1 Tax=Amphimedon queenslandica TaxID=400682 RepID=A0A1X7VAZ3_AMPQE
MCPPLSQHGNDSLLVGISNKYHSPPCTLHQPMDQDGLHWWDPFQFCQTRTHLLACISGS